MIKSFNEMRQIDVIPFTEKRDGIAYLSWAECYRLLHENGAEIVYHEPLVNERTGSTLFMTDHVYGSDEKTHRCYEVRVKITIDDLEFVINYPLINGTNPVRDNSITQLRINTAQQRAFVKGVAMRTGLGFDLWLKDPEADRSDDLTRHSMMAIRQRVYETVSYKIRKYGSQAALSRALNITEAQLKKIMQWYDQLDSFEKKLNAI